MKIIVISLILLLTGCVASKPNPSGFDEKQVQTENFTINIWEKNGLQSGHPIRIYIEGDGDPNPRQQIAKHFAEQDATQNVIYVARPCQWSNEKICKQKPEIYQKERFNPVIIDDMVELLAYLIRKHHAPQIELIAYDGGAVIALNAALKLPVSRIITIAGITDLAAYASYNNVKIPKTAEDPAKKLMLLATIPQIHYVGADDDITPRRLVERFVSKMRNPKSAVVKVVPRTNHIDWKDVGLDY